MTESASHPSCVQAAIDPTLGNEVVVVMRKEIHRMKLRLAEVLGQQERLIGDMERAILKRDNIATKGRAQGAKKGAGGLLLMETGLVKACADLKRSVKETEKEVSAGPHEGRLGGGAQ